jgi:hypothetical protein
MCGTGKDKITGGNIYIKAEYNRGNMYIIRPLRDTSQVQRVPKVLINFIII